MKKLMALLLCLIMSMGFASGMAEEENSFDAGWAGKEYTMPIPAPPFAQFAVEVSGDPESVLKYQVMSTSTEEIDALKMEDIIAYCEELKAIGFTNVDTEGEVEKQKGYEFAAQRPADEAFAYLAYSGTSQYILLMVEQHAPAGISNSFTALIPKLPFHGWGVTEETERVCKMEIGGLNTSEATHSADSGEDDGADKAVLIGYIESLNDHGFVVEEVAEGYQWRASDELGNKLEIMCAEGYCWLTITKAAEKVEKPEEKELVNENSNTNSGLPELPEGNWETKDTEEGIRYVLENATREQAEEYVQKLKEANYQLQDEFADDRELFWAFTSEDGVSLTVGYRIKYEEFDIDVFRQ